MVYHQYEAPEKICIGKLFWIWGAYALTMMWLSHVLTAAGFPAAGIWTLAIVAGLMLFATLEM